MVHRVKKECWSAGHGQGALPWWQIVVTFELLHCNGYRNFLLPWWWLENEYRNTSLSGHKSTSSFQENLCCFPFVSPALEGSCLVTVLLLETTVPKISTVCFVCWQFTWYVKQYMICVYSSVKRKFPCWPPQNFIPYFPLKSVTAACTG